VQPAGSTLNSSGHESIHKLIDSVFFVNGTQPQLKGTPEEKFTAYGENPREGWLFSLMFYNNRNH
jgi:hypothetical protein